MACLLFADIDHLKQINDQFGHVAGDLAIMKGADYLNEALGENALIGRIGGDEYLPFVILDSASDSIDLKTKTKDIVKSYNSTSGEDFYIELSVGLTQFVCCKDADISEYIDKSDEILYVDKKNRRATVSK